MKARLRFPCIILLNLILVFPAASRADGTPPPCYIVITAPAFKDALQPLLKHRASPEGGNFQVTLLVTSDLLTPDELQHQQTAKLRDKIQSLVSQNRNAKTYVLLVGPAFTSPFDGACLLPICLGSIGRMKGQPTDNPFSLPDAQQMSSIAVGRLPARTPGEVTAMVNKILAFERNNPKAPWRRSLTLLVGNPGGDSFAEKAIANWFINSSFTSMLDSIHPLWSLRLLVHIPSSFWYVPDAALHDKAIDFVQQGQTFWVYLGHSGPEALWSSNIPFLTRDDFAKLNIPNNAAGIYVTCSCFACQYDSQAKPDHEGYALAAMCNPSGPVAVIGATAESYSAAGYLALNGLIQDFASTGLPDRLGDAFLHVKAGLNSGPIDRLTFSMFDYGDGSSGSIPLAIQRQEHLEMWTLLGDPALRLPDVYPEILLTTVESAAPGQSIALQITLPKTIPLSTPITLTVECPASVVQKDKLLAVPASPEEARNRAILSNLEIANNHTFASVTITPTASPFTYNLPLPNDLPYLRVILRATASTPPGLGVTSVRIDADKPAANSSPTPPNGR